MNKKVSKGVYLKEEVNFEPELKKNKKVKTKYKGDNNGKKKKKKINGEDIS